MRKNQKTGRQHRERRPENGHAHACLNELIDYETKRKLKALRDELTKEAKHD